MRTRTRSRIQRTRSRKPRTRLRTVTLAHTTRSYDETPGASIFCDARLRPPGLTGLRWLGCVAWRGRLASLESLFVPPRVPNRDRGTSKGSSMRSEWGGKGSTPGGEPVSPAARTTRHRASSGSTLNMKLPTNILRQICFHTFRLQYVLPGFLHERSPPTT